MQCHLCHVIFHDVHKYSNKNTIVKNHTIEIPRDEDVMLSKYIPYMLKGATSYFPLQTTTLYEQEWMHVSIPLNCGAPDWDAGF